MKSFLKVILQAVTSRYVVYAANLASIIVLARLIDPSGFGTVATSMLFLYLYQGLCDGSLMPSVNNTRRLNSGILGHLLLLLMFTGLFLGTLFFFSATALAEIFDNTDLNSVVKINSFAFFAIGLSSLICAVFTRHKKFRSIAIAGVLSEALTTSGCVFLLKYTDIGFLALALKVSLLPWINLVTLVYFYRRRVNKLPKPIYISGKIFDDAFLEVFRFQFLITSVNSLARNLDYMIIGLVFGPATLGFYEKSFQLMKYPISLLGFSLTPAIQPALRLIKSKPQAVGRIYSRFQIILASCSIVISGIMWYFCDGIVDTLFGSGWAIASEYLKILIIGVPAQVAMVASGGFLIALGGSKNHFYCSVVAFVLLVIALVYGSFMVINMYILCYAIVLSYYVSCIFLLFNFNSLLRQSQMRLTDE